LFERGSTSRRALDQQISATNQNRLVVANRRIAVETWPSREAALLARLQAAEAEVARAAETVAKTTVTASWDAVVLDADVEAGRAVLPGSQIALIATVHEAEARLPILLEDAMRVLGEETLSRRAPAEGSEPSGAFSADLGSMDRPFPGTLIRLEGRVDPATRQLTAVLQLNDTGSSQLATYDGLFGSITITGRQESGYIVPRRAVHDGGKVWLIDADNTLRSRQPALEALDGDHWFSPLDGGLKDGDRLVLTEPDRFTDGLPTVPVDMAAKAEDENEAASP
jgi:multidrug efflux pump subunit AcrA (membrane-fusion protein)